MTSQILSLVLLIITIVGKFPACASLAEDKVEIANPPNPLDLTTDFFDYYHEPDPVTLLRKIEMTEAALTAMYASLAPNLQNQMLVYVNKIAINLEALPKLRSEKGSSHKARLYKNRYTFENIESLLNQEVALQDELSELEKERVSLTSLLKKMRRHIDSQMAAYLKESANTSDKLLLGLQIFAHMSSLAVMEEKERLTKEKIAEESAEIAHLSEEAGYAFNHLDLSVISEAALSKQIEGQKEVLSMAELGSLHAELSASGMFGASEKEISESFLYTQKSIRSQISQASIRLAILELEAKRAIVAEADGKASSLTLEEIQGWIRDIQDIGYQAGIYEAKTEQELDRVGHLGLLLDEKEEGAKASSPLIALARQRYSEVQTSLNDLDLLKRKQFFTLSLAGWAEAHLERSMSYWEITKGYIGGIWSGCCSTLQGWLHESLFKVAGVPVTLMGLLEGLMILGGAYLFSFLIRFGIRRALWDKGSVAQSSLFILDRLLHYLLLVIGGVLALLSAGLEISSVFWVLGALSVGIGFGLQTIVNNFASSLILLFSRSVKVQDYIQLQSGEWGQVMDISVQNTIVRTSDGIEIVIPNSELISNKFMNWTMHDPYKRLHIPFGVAYGTDKDFVEKVAKEAAGKISATITNHPHLEGPRVWLKGLGESSLDFELVVWVNMFTAKGAHGSLQSSYLWEIETALTKHGIEIPFPRCDLVVRTPVHIQDSSLAPAGKAY
ncbi:mechanosensitive ion channel domain-containing protein [Estrella lausannensis]|uniref:Mechanosensitive ion channel MscS n=1 Tax=Estrella lausannensis TaxID=483423 RepID=A0A0H5DRW9_9BACT|nr:mechanosensitive ion channel domain-containing protein [Estrella lausannensis]CRX38474.1 Mechanosensitive ion channel MscS [Estrella lausannensis]